MQSYKIRTESPNPHFWPFMPPFPHFFAHRTALLLPVWLLLHANPTALSAPADSLVRQRLTTLLNQVQNSPSVRYGTIALSVRRVQDGQCLIDYNARQCLSTASTLKLITTATALAVLGPTYTYTTTLEYDGTLRDSVLTGNLYVRGTGDPSLGSGRFTDYADAPTLFTTWSDAVRAAGIKLVQGAVVGDASLYSGQTTPDTWPWSDLGNYYGAGLSALNINENLYRVIFRPGKTIGSPAPVLRTEPPTPYLTFSNHVTTDAAGSGDQVNIYNAPFARQPELTGTVPAGVSEFVVKGSLPDPAYTVAAALHDRLLRDSIVVSGSPATYRSAVSGTMLKPSGARHKLLDYKSPMLSDLVQQTNYQSINLYAEALLRTTALALSKTTLTFDESLKAVAQFWRNKGVNLDGFRPKDGSGLSTVGGITAENMTGILAAMTKEPAFTAFYQSIPVVGQSGTVKNLARNTAAAGNVRAKSGSIEGVRAYAGYFTTTTGERLCFSVMVNKFTPGQTRDVVAQLEKILALLPGL